MNYYEECPKCGSTNIIYCEWLGAYDGAMSVECNSCNTNIHRASGKEILKLAHEKEYGPVTFYLEGGDVYINNIQVGKES